MLRDMEEVVVNIKKENIRNYMKEALNCYNVGSYRGCIILSTIAAMHDLYEKIDILANSVKEARELVKEIDKLKSEGNVYERFMVEKASAITILTPEEKKKISAYLDIRNQCAHPNLHISSAEEARAVFMGLIDEVINKPALLGPAYIGVFIERLENEKFFPNFTKDNILNTVNEEIVKLHKQTIIPIVDKTITLIETSQSDSIKWKNAAAFIAGMLVVIKNEEQLRAISQRFNKLVEKESLFDSMIIFTKMFPQVVSFLQPSDRNRYISQLNSTIKKHRTTERMNVIKLLMQNQILNETETEDFINNLETEINNTIKIVSDNTSRASVSNLNEWSSFVNDINIQPIDNTFFNVLYMLISDNDYNVVNDAINLFKILHEDFIMRIDGNILVNIFIEIIKQAHGPGRGSDEANNLISTNFTQIQFLLDYFIDYSTKDFEQLSYVMEKLFRGEEYILKVIYYSQRYDALDKVINIYMDSFENDSIEIETTLAFIS
ncbi:hypothetical protein, partial [Niallia circulans]|uniref:hypothetical protein n=1 Tax=Niallia circulans TaxID=1397 RepID=UPI001561A790